MATATEQLLSFHIYRISCLFGDDKVVKAHDKVSVMYYLKASRSDTQWRFSLHTEGPDGTVFCRVSSGYIGPPTIFDLSPGPMLVDIIPDNQKVEIETRQGAPEGTRWFRGPDDKEYQWRSSRYFWRNEMKCFDIGGEVVATYRAVAMSILKDGELRIFPSGRFMTDLLVATSLAMRMPSH